MAVIGMTSIELKIKWKKQEIDNLKARWHYLNAEVRRANQELKQAETELQNLRGTKLDTDIH